ncbi:zinc-binding dehydrogenase [Baekduia soli]|uniref:Zinc-binding dehydrogenase n=1 Tax=Baekduia soli TaxID=496014 RepID=A0A5B8U6A0_9ACTN|nr:zinc-binding dehydrogenase [Baekduia soli]QEC48425.1 zinc-binding dehydrogenase [Baekduia soli]
MKAVRYHEYGTADVLRYEDVEKPVPGPGEVLIRVEACGVNHFDIDLRAGVSRWPLPLPHQLGVEFAGTVDAVGEGVEHLAVGDGVWPQHEVECLTCRYCRAGQPNLCLDAKMMSVQFPGGYAEYVLAPARATHLLPDGVTAEMAAAGQVAFATAWHMIVTRGRLQPGQTVVVQSAGSGIGHGAIQIAALNGARVIATAGAEHKLQTARELGASETINYNEESIAERVLEMTDGEGADLFIEHVGGDLFMDSLRALRKDGRLVTCGGHGGETPPIDLVELFRHEWQVIGSRIGTPAEMILTMKLMGEGKLKPHVHAALPLSEAPEAHRIIEGRKQTGKVVLVP